MNLNPFINLINSIISLYSFSLIAWIILGLLIRFEIVNSYQYFVKQLTKLGQHMFEPVLLRIRKIIPTMGTIDLSPLVLLLLLNFIKDFLFTYLYKF